MSTQKGNNRRTRSQKHHNSTVFKNSLHDTNKRTKKINSLEVEGCCGRCTGIIEWKIKYKKYKPLTIPKKCIKCSQKTVKRAYCIVCYPCALSHDICTKCGQNKDIVQPVGLSEEEQMKKQAQLEQELKLLPERKRRTFLRLQTTGKQSEELDEGCRKGDADDSDDPSELSDYTASETSDEDTASGGPDPDTDGTTVILQEGRHEDTIVPNLKNNELPNEIVSDESLPVDVIDPTAVADDISKIHLTDKLEHLQ